jgi:hypothetical protein
VPICGASSARWDNVPTDSQSPHTKGT